MGVQVALVFDASNNVRQAGLTNAPRLQEVKDTIDSFARTNFLDDERDWLTFIALGDDATPQVIGPRLDDAWENYDYQAVWNSVILYEPREGSTVTPLYDLVKFAVQQFAAPKLPMNQERHIVVFSDGSDQVSVLQSEQVIGLANQHNIRVHTVQLGNPAPQSERNLKQLSELTGGTYVSLDSIQALAPIVDAMRVTVDQTVLTYRSQRADPGEIRVEAILSDNQVINATDRAPAVNIQPAAITVLQTARLNHLCPQRCLCRWRSSGPTGAHAMSSGWRSRWAAKQKWLTRPPSTQSLRCPSPSWARANTLCVCAPSTNWA